MNKAIDKEILGKFTPRLEHTTKREAAWIIFTIILILLGIFALITQIKYGHIVTGMRDNVVWGIYIVNFIFFMGISYAGAMVAGALHLFKAEWSKPILRIAEFLTVFTLLIGPLYILLCVGRLDKLHYLVLFGRIQSPITWDVIAISTDIVGCVLFLYLSLLRDFASLRDYKELKIPNWKRRLYTWLSIYWTDSPEQRKRLSTTIDIMSAMVIAIAIIVYSVLAWLFSVTLQPGWHSTIFGPYFVVAAVYSGTAVIIVLMWVYRKIYKLNDLITRQHFVNMGILLLVMGAFFAYFTFSEYLTKWYGSEKNDQALISVLFNRYYYLFILSNYIGVLFPLTVVGIPKFRTIPLITLSAFIVIIALWLNRYLIVVPTLESPYLPVQDAREAWIHYRGSWVEWILTLGGIGSISLLFLLAAKLVPVIPLDAMISKKSEQKIEK